MTNHFAAAVYLPCLVLTGAALVFAVLFQRHKRLTPSFLFFGGSMFLWQLIEVLYFQTPSLEASYFLYDLNLPFVASATLGAFILVMRFYSLDEHLDPYILSALGVIPAITLVLALAYQRHAFLRTRLVILSTVPIHTTDTARGPWFWVHAIYCYAIMLATLVIILMQHRKLAKICRAPSRLLAVGILATAVGNVLVLTKALNTNLDFSMVAGTVTVLCWLLATQHNQGMDVIIQARRRIFDEIDTCIHIYDNEGKQISSNKTSRLAMQRLGIRPAGDTCDDMLAALQAAAFLHKHSEEDGGGVDYYYQTAEDGQAVFNNHRHPILNNLGKEIGCMLVSTDISENALLIRQLEEAAEIDSLTGLSNRRRMEQDKQLLDTPAHLPLAVIMGDLNNLKVVNDTRGHVQGDLMLHEAADILTRCCPPGGRIARIGGDEFMILLPLTTAQQAAQMVENIAYTADKSAHTPPPSIALGFAVKEQAGQCLEQVIADADAAMYANKAAYKRQRQAALPTR